MRPNDFASYLLAIGICNLLLYFAFYIIMKVSDDGQAYSACRSVFGEGDGHSLPRGSTAREGEFFCPSIYASEV